VKSRSLRWDGYLGWTGGKEVHAIFVLEHLEHLSFVKEKRWEDNIKIRLKKGKNETILSGNVWTRIRPNTGILIAAVSNL
jgi:hypothetical protein